MSDIYVNSLEEGVEVAISELKNFCENKKNVNLCLTGGKFGSSFTRNLSFLKESEVTFNFLLSDERFVSINDKNSNVRLIKECLKQNLNLTSSNLIFFNTTEDHSLSFQTIRSELERKHIFRADFLILSLGSDGHLAGHFNHSILDETKNFCHTYNAPMPTNYRVSFSLKWLSGAKKIILAAIGEEKKYELEKLKKGVGLHSNLLKHPDLIILS